LSTEVTHQCVSVTYILPPHTHLCRGSRKLNMAIERKSERSGRRRDLPFFTCKVW